jgi:hypothetical protein
MNVDAAIYLHPNVIIPQHQALWAEQGARRRTGAPDPTPRDNPMRPDPYSLFASCPTRALSGEDRIVSRPGMTWEAPRRASMGSLRATAATAG